MEYFDNLNNSKLSLQNSLIVVSQHFQKEKQWKEIGRSKFVENTAQPQYKKTFLVSFQFCRIQQIRIEYFQEKKPKPENLFGIQTFNLGELMGKHKKRLRSKIIDPINKEKNVGSSKIIGKEIRKDNTNIKMTWKASKLKKDLFGSVNPFLRFSRSGEKKNENILVYETEIIAKNQSPEWSKFELKCSDLCNCEENRKILIECFDKKKKGKPNLIGYVNTNLAELQDGNKKNFTLIDPKKKKKKISLGTLRLEKFSQNEIHSILDFLSSNIKLSTIVAVDFTISNGLPSFNESLHFRNPPNFNQYEQSIVSLCEILNQYSNLSQIAAFGFGGKIQLKKKVISSDLFPLNGNIQDPECEGIKGVLDSYSLALNNVGLNGPTKFGPILKAISFISKVNIKSEYINLIILTDDKFIDNEEVKENLKVLSNLPVSIIIVGIGENHEFASMDYLKTESFFEEAELSRHLVNVVSFQESFHKGEFQKKAFQDFQNQFLNYYLLQNKKK
ncbi:copine [Anaeramoeba flamelloides]|uniref:Copine n=1 Tax=Anaeramoeba flamelloides TaxID=1746091 RepID=A0ABQ8XNG1_9EUKA|nr:copine [Anaeramoeba flamelloides]